MACGGWLVSPVEIDLVVIVITVLGSLIGLCIYYLTT